MKWIPNKLRILLQFERGLLIQYGWLRSWWANEPVDRDGRPLPWLTYPAIDFLSQFDFSGSHIFEWGSGNSTLWWQRRAKSIVSVESDPAWAQKLKLQLTTNVEYRITKRGARDEIAVLHTFPPRSFDVIVIDNHGPFRWRCAESALGYLAKGGMIILDNSEQCLRAAKVLRDAGLIEIDFSGFAPFNNYAQTTSIFFREFLKFKTADELQPHRSIAQPNTPWENC
jgi:hypothetical protein